MRHIAMISEHASPLTPAGSIDSGGQNVYVAQLARHLCQRGLSVDVFTRRDNPLLPPIVEVCSNLRLIHVPAGPAAPLEAEALLPMMDEFGRFLENFIGEQPQRYEVLHANFFMSGLAALRAMQKHRMPLVMSFHALAHELQARHDAAAAFSAEHKAIEAQLVRAATRIVASCPQHRHELISRYGAERSRIDLVAGGYDPRELPPLTRSEARNALGWHPRRFTLLLEGPLPQPGAETLIQALALLRKQYRLETRLRITGSDAEVSASPEIVRLKTLATTLGIAESLRFTGRHGRDHLSYLYHAADVFVTTPGGAPFAIAPIEAMACGLPVVGIQGNCSAVIDSVNGRVVPPHDAAALAATLAELYASPQLREAYGRAGQRRARASYTWKRVARGIDDSYRRAHDASIAARAPSSTSARRLHAPDCPALA